MVYAFREVEEISLFVEDESLMKEESACFGTGQQNGARVDGCTIDDQSSDRIVRIVLDDSEKTSRLKHPANFCGQSIAEQRWNMMIDAIPP